MEEQYPAGFFKYLKYNEEKEVLIAKVIFLIVIFNTFYFVIICLCSSWTYPEFPLQTSLKAVWLLFCLWII